MLYKEYEVKKEFGVYKKGSIVSDRDTYIRRKLAEDKNRKEKDTCLSILNNKIDIKTNTKKNEKEGAK